ncbi:hypothetical protein [Synechococcus sp. GFB01]|uniref:hypothetical protein n=1 Tax=Synechococcus sp. GFB01 TaxID=1662190 RepID=UPI0013792F12|nr:hypothetical protein [Synechococcus sp. GFB01]
MRSNDLDGEPRQPVTGGQHGMGADQWADTEWRNWAIRVIITTADGVITPMP